MNLKYYLQSLKEYPVGLQRLETEFVIEPSDGSEEDTKRLCAEDMQAMRLYNSDFHFNKELSKYVLSLFDVNSVKELILMMHHDDANSSLVLRLIDRVERFYTLREKGIQLRYFFEDLIYMHDDKYTAKFFIASTGDFSEDKKLCSDDMDTLGIAKYDFSHTDDPSMSLVVFDAESAKKVLYLERDRYSYKDFYRTMKIIDRFFTIKERLE